MKGKDEGEDEDKELNYKLGNVPFRVGGDITYRLTGI